MADPSVNYPLYSQQQDATAPSKYSSNSSPKPSLYESESPLVAHSSTSSSRLSGSYEPSQVSSMVDDLNSELAQMRMNESTSAMTGNNNKPYLPGLILPTSNRPGPPVHAPYTNYHSYPNYFPVPAGSPVLREHPTYSYGPIFATREQHPHHVSFPSPIHYNSPAPPPIHYNSPPAPDMPRRASVGVYYNYEYGTNTPLSPVSPYGFHMSSPPMMYMPTPQPQPYPASPPLVPLSATRQARTEVRPLVSSPLRPLGAAVAPGRRQGPSLFSSASTFGHQASLLANRANRRTDHRETPALPRSGLLSDFKNHKLKRYELKVCPVPFPLTLRY